MVDRYFHGEVERISPEAPVPIFKVDRREERPGGAANVLANVCAMGAPAQGLYSPTSFTNPVVKERYIVRGQQLLRVDYDRPQEPVPMPAFQPKGIIIFSDYGKGALSNIQDLLGECPDDCIVLVDPKGYDYSRYWGADVIKPNKDEMVKLVGGWKDEDQLARKAEDLILELGLKAILLTRGAEGMTLYRLDTPPYHVPSVAREVYDVCGAGDTAIAAFAVALYKGYHYAQATIFANRAAGVAVQHLGAYVVQEKEVFYETTGDVPHESD